MTGQSNGCPVNVIIREKFVMMEKLLVEHNFFNR